MQKYLPVEVKREEIKLLFSLENVHFFQVEYYTSIMEYDNSINYTKSKSYVGGVSLFEENKVRI